jgi:hypothetical protein
MAEERDISTTLGTVQLTVTNSSAMNPGNKDPTSVTLALQQTTGSIPPPARNRGQKAAAPSDVLPRFTHGKK